MFVLEDYVWRRVLPTDYFGKAFMIVPWIELEGLVDKTSLRGLIQDLVSIAEDKATHVRDNLQDEPLADSWDQDAQQLRNVFDRLRN